MPRRDYVHCKNCNKHRDECGVISCSRLCVTCASERLFENVHGLHEKKGPAVIRWRRAMAASVGAVLVDDVLGER